MEYRIFDKKNPPLEVLKLKTSDEQKFFLDPLEVILKEYGDVDQWKALSIHLNSTEPPIGFAIIGSFGSDDTWIDDIMIDKAYQGKGYGTRAIKYLVNYLIENYHVDHIYLSCYKENTKALSLYQKLGFKITDKLDENGEIILVYNR
jgi:diamine N-acetyltransferase